MPARGPEGGPGKPMWGPPGPPQTPQNQEILCATVVVFVASQCAAISVAGTGPTARPSCRLLSRAPGRQRKPESRRAERMQPIYGHRHCGGRRPWSQPAKNNKPGAGKWAVPESHDIVQLYNSQQPNDGVDEHSQRRCGLQRHVKRVVFFCIPR